MIWLKFVLVRETSDTLGQHSDSITYLEISECTSLSTSLRKGTEVGRWVQCESALLQQQQKQQKQQQDQQQLYYNFNKAIASERKSFSRSFEPTNDLIRSQINYNLRL